MKLAVESFLLLTVFTCGSLITWAVLALRCAARKERESAERELDAAVQRHPANGCEGWTPPAVRYLGGNDDVTPFSARTVCGHLIWGDSLGDLLANEVYHHRVCEQLNRREAA